MGISVVAKCNACGHSAQVRMATRTMPGPGQAKMKLAGKKYLLPQGWSAEEGPVDLCFCSQKCVDGYEAKVVVEEIEELQAKLAQIRARAKMNAQGEG